MQGYNRNSSAQQHDSCPNETFAHSIETELDYFKHTPANYMYTPILSSNILYLILWCRLCSVLSFLLLFGAHSRSFCGWRARL